MRKKRKGSKIGIGIFGISIGKTNISNNSININQSIGSNVKSKGDITFTGNTQSSNGVQIKMNDVSISTGNGKININGTETDIPQHVLDSNPKCTLMDGNKIYINGYQFKNGEFKKNLRTYLKCVFS